MNPKTFFILNEPYYHFICIVGKEVRWGMLQMDTGWIVSLIVAGLLMVLILAIAIPMVRKYVVRENGKINYMKTKIYLRCNVFDTLTLGLAIYSIICVQVLNILVYGGETETLDNKISSIIYLDCSFFPAIDIHFSSML
jgi:hypothetical protein